MVVNFCFLTIYGIYLRRNLGTGNRMRSLRQALLAATSSQMWGDLSSSSSSSDGRNNLFRFRATSTRKRQKVCQEKIFAGFCDAAAEGVSVNAGCEPVGNAVLSHPSYLPKCPSDPLLGAVDSSTAGDTFNFYGRFPWQIFPDADGVPADLALPPVKVLVQRVSQASVHVDGELHGQIGQGLLLLVGFGPNDGDQALRFCAEKCAHLRIFADDQGKMNRSVLDIGGGVLAISQFTLYGDCRKGRRPSFVQAAPPPVAQSLYEHFLDLLAEQGLSPQRGVFGAYMQVEIHNDGPVTLMVESPA